MAFPVIKRVRAFAVRGGGADDRDQGEGCWIAADGTIDFAVTTGGEPATYIVDGHPP